MSNISDIIWGEWRQLPNGQWHREGQDSLGNWYEDNRDVDPTVPRSQPGEGYDDLPGDFGDLTIDPSPNAYPYQGQDSVYGGYNQATTGQHSQGTVTSDNYPRSSETETRHKGKSRHHENPEQYEPSPRGHDRGKGSRSSKGDVKGHGHPSSRSHGKSSRSSRTDVKGKSRDIEQQPAIASSSRHVQSQDDDPGDAPPGGKHARLGVEGMAQQLPPGSMQMPQTMFPAGYPTGPMMTQHTDNFGQFDENFASDLPEDLQHDVADMYNNPIPGSSSAAGAYTRPEEEEEEERGDQVPDLPRRASYSRPSRTKVVSDESTYNEDWSKYVEENSRKFQFGTVFKIMWSEPMGNSRLSKQNKDPVGTGTSISEFGKRDYKGTILYEGIRRFIVVDGNENGARNGNSICVPIATYKKQGCMKHGIKPHHHGVIHTQDTPPMLLQNEPDLGVAPIRLVVNRDLQGVERLQPESRINYSKHVTIEHNSRVHLIGRIHPDDLGTLEQAVDAQWEKRVRDRKKDKKQERSRR